MAKIKIDKEDSIEGEVVETEWDLKRLVIGFVLLSLLIIVGAYIFFPYSENSGSESEKTLGVSTSEEEIPPLPNKDTISTVIADAQKNLSQITADNLTSSEAAIQKIITDLQGLQNKNGAVEAICKLVCKDK